MSTHLYRSEAILVVLALIAAFSAVAEIPSGWIVAGNAPRDYDFSRDASTAANGRYSALISAKPGITSNGFGTLMQIVDAGNYRGARWRLSGYMKTDDVDKAQMWMRVDGLDKQILGFDNMDSRPVRGTTAWARYEIVLDVPADSTDIAFGFFLAQGHGKVWGDSFKLEKVDLTIPVTAPSGVTAPRPKDPVNTDFESQ
jgi:hypothetical protein